MARMWGYLRHTSYQRLNCIRHVTSTVMLLTQKMLSPGEDPYTPVPGPQYFELFWTKSIKIVNTFPIIKLLKNNSRHCGKDIRNCSRSSSSDDGAHICQSWDLTITLTWQGRCIREIKWCCFRPTLCTLFRLN